MASPDSSWFAEIQKIGWRGEASVASTSAVILLFLIYYDNGVWHKKMLTPPYFNYYVVLIVAFLLSLFLLLFRWVEFYRGDRIKHMPQQIDQQIKLLNEYLWKHMTSKYRLQTEMRNDNEDFFIEVTVSQQQPEDIISYRIKTYYSATSENGRPDLEKHTG